MTTTEDSQSTCSLQSSLLIPTTDSKTKKQQLSIICKIKPFRALVFFNLLYNIPNMMVGIFMVGYIAAYFGHCNINKDHDSKSDKKHSCSFNYGKASVYISISVALAGLVSFLTNGLLGKISDSIGRKPMFYVYCIVRFINYIPMVINKNYVIYWLSLNVLSGVTGSPEPTSFMLASTSDVVENRYRTVSFSVFYFTSGIALVLATVIAIIIPAIFLQQTNFLVMCVFYVVCIVYTKLFVYETLDLKQKLPFKIVCMKNINPFRTLCNVRNNVMLKYICILQFLLNLVLVGTQDILIIYVLDQLNVSKGSKANLISGLFLLCGSFSMALSQGLVVPMLRKYNVSNYKIIIYGFYCQIIGLVGIIFISLFKNYILIFGSSFILTCGNIFLPASNSILTDYLTAEDQGSGIGTVYSYNALAGVFSPLLFGIGYSICKQQHMAFLPYLVGLIFLLVTVPIILLKIKHKISNVQNDKIQTIVNN